MWCLLFVQEVANINTSAGIPYPFNETISLPAYLGLEKLSYIRKDMGDYIKVSFSAPHCCVPERVESNGASHFNRFLLRDASRWMKEVHT